MLVYLIKKDQGLCLKSMVYLSLMVRVILAMALKFQLENLAKLLLEMTLKSVLKAQSSVIIMSNLVMVVCSWDVLVMDTDFHKIYNQQNEVINQDREVIISDNVWIGCRALILKGSAIPSGSIIGAGSVVSSRCKFDNALYAGVPALKLKDNIKWNS
ncbi:hypothetical protein C4Z35_010015 [Klebsiella pneumoniae subsp. pneumoniae]|nr:hypothetical protein C4Z35_010015 [Klebsiella pneumoniae subsp. pneumoniae]